MRGITFLHDTSKNVQIILRRPHAEPFRQFQIINAIALARKKRFFSQAQHSSCRQILKQAQSRILKHKETLRRVLKNLNSQSLFSTLSSLEKTHLHTAWVEEGERQKTLIPHFELPNAELFWKCVIQPYCPFSKGHLSTNPTCLARGKRTPAKASSDSTALCTPAGKIWIHQLVKYGSPK